MLKGFYTVALLIISNTFMTLAWYGHLKFSEMSWSRNLGLMAIILISWGVAFFEYVFQVPANRIGFERDGGPFSLLQLKIIQEAISISVFILFTLLVFKSEKIAWNHLVGFGLILLAVFFFFKKW